MIIDNTEKIHNSILEPSTIQELINKSKSCSVTAIPHYEIISVVNDDTLRINNAIIKCEDIIIIKSINLCFIRVHIEHPTIRMGKDIRENKDIVSRYMVSPVERKYSIFNYSVSLSSYIIHKHGHLIISPEEDELDDIIITSALDIKDEYAAKNTMYNMTSIKNNPMIGVYEKDGINFINEFIRQW